MTKAQEIIMSHLKDGAKLDCTEGKNYKAWISMADGTKIPIRTRSAEVFCEKFTDKLIFTNEGIFWKK